MKNIPRFTLKVNELNQVSDVHQLAKLAEDATLFLLYDPTHTLGEDRIYEVIDNVDIILKIHGFNSKLVLGPRDNLIDSVNMFANYSCVFVIVTDQELEMFQKHEDKIFRRPWLIALEP